MLDYSHNPWLVVASLCVAMMAGFTGLSLTKGLAEQSLPQRKIAIAIAAISLGGGIWSMHFVAMLGLQLPILFYYDAVITLISALVAILVVGCALLILHFRRRTPVTLALSGSIVGMGILAMHYIGMAGLELCRAEHTVPGVLFAVFVSCGLSIASFWVAYSHRTHRNIILGTLCFGGSVFLVHFIAIYGTTFTAVSDQNVIGPVIGKEILAIGVVLSSFVLCAAFLLTGVTFLSTGNVQNENLSGSEKPDPDPPSVSAGLQHIPYEKDGRTQFVDYSAVAVVRAEGHYTFLYTKADKLFCVWSITDAQARLPDSMFVKSHRSFLINPAHVSSFKRLKDNGVCYFDEISSLDKAPVSRSRLKIVQKALGL